MVVLLVAVHCGRLRAADERARIPEAGWIEVGSFQGAQPTGWLSRINNWLFEYERDDSLFQDLGDVGLGFGVDIGDVAVDWDSFFRNRVVQAHEELTPGSTVSESDLSTFKSVSRARTRLRLSWEYLPDLIGEIGVGVELEGGYSLAMARTRPPRIASDRAFEPYTRDKAGKELKSFFREQDLSLADDLVDLAFGSTAAVVDKAAGELGERIADTENAATFYDAYADPITFITTTHLPPKPVLFTAEQSPLAAGDALTFTTFVGFSPLRASFKETGLKASFKRFRRWIRETTIRKEPNRFVVVRVRTLRWDGNELIPFKIRPEFRFLFVITVGYTFFEIQRDAFDEVVSDVTYRIDVASESGRQFFEHLVGQATRVDRVPAPENFTSRAGVEILSSEFRQGRTRDRRLRARLASWFVFKQNHITSIQQVRTGDADLQEVIRARIQEQRKPFGLKRRYKIKSVITVQSDLAWRQDDPPPDIHVGEQIAATLETTFSAPLATGADVRTLGENLETIVGFAEPPPAFEPLKTLADDQAQGLIFELLLSFGPEQIRRLERVTENQLWIVLGELLMGADFRGAWSTPARRFWWRPTERAHGRANFADRHISEHYDRLRGYRRKRKKVLGFDPRHRGSRELFIMAARAVKRFRGLQRQIHEGDCMGCMAGLLAKASDVVLLQALMVRFAGGVDSGEVGIRAEVFSEDMPAPAVVSNGVSYTYRHQRGGEIVEDVENLRDSQPRLRGGSVLLNVAADDVAAADEPCWKLRLYSDFRFEPQMPLRVYLREVRWTTDREIQIATLDLGEPRPVPQGPFMLARYFYDVQLPWSGRLEADKPYSMLLRVLNSQELPVTEEQEIRLELPVDWQQEVSRRCRPAVDASEAVAPPNGSSQAAVVPEVASLSSSLRR